MHVVAILRRLVKKMEPVMSKRILTIFCVAVMVALCGGAARAEPWVNGYVVAFYGHAFRYGGRADYYRGTEIEPGVDCSHGSTTHFTKPAEVAKTFSLINWRTPQEVQTLANPPRNRRGSQPRRPVFPYLAGRLRLSWVQQGDSELRQSLCGRRPRRAGSDRPYWRRIQPGRADQIQRFREPGWRERDR